MLQFESPIEHDFYFSAIKFLADSLELQPQVVFSTRAGQLRVDFIVNGKQRIAFECDGREFHEQFRDEVRDAILLGEEHIDVIYHIPGALIHHHPLALFQCISQWNPEIFSQRAREVFEGASRQAGWSEVDKSSEFATVERCQITRRQQFVPPERRSHWKSIYEWAKTMPSMSIDELVSARQRR